MLVSPSLGEAHDIKPNNHLKSPSLSTANIDYVETNDLNNYSTGITTITPLLPPSSINTPPLSTTFSDFDQVSNFAWISINSSIDYSDIQTSFQEIDDDLHNFLLNICEWELADCCLLHQLSISTIRHIVSLPPSTIDNLDFPMCLLQDLWLMNWWPHFRCQPSKHVLDLNMYAYYTSLQVMSAKRSYQRCPKNQRPHRQSHCQPTHQSPRIHTNKPPRQRYSTPDYSKYIIENQDLRPP